MKNSNLDLNVAIIALYTVVPSWHGAADISRLMLKYFPSSQKCLFQMVNSKQNIKVKKILLTKIFFIIHQY